LVSSEDNGSNRRGLKKNLSFGLRLRDDIQMRLPAGSHLTPVLCAAPRILLLPVNVFALFCSQQPGPRGPEKQKSASRMGREADRGTTHLVSYARNNGRTPARPTPSFQPCGSWAMFGRIPSAGSQLSPLSARLSAPYSSHSSSFEYLMSLLSITKIFRLSRELFFFPINFPISTKIAFCLDNACKAVIMISRRKEKQKRLRNIEP
jgi:hypothetical protein